MASSTKVIAQNKKARFDVAIEETFRAGLVLTGDEIKSVRAGRAQLVGGYVRMIRPNAYTAPRIAVVGLHQPFGVRIDAHNSRTA